MNNVIKFLLGGTPLKTILEKDALLREQLSDNIVAFKHTDSNVVFLPDSDNGVIYAVDRDSKNFEDDSIDLFAGCHIASEFRAALEAHYGKDGLEAIKADFAGCELDFANKNITGDASVREVLGLA